MRKYTFLFLVSLFATGCFSGFAQSVGINDNGSSPNSKAMLDVSSISKGFLPPRMTLVQRNSITGAPAGLIIWCSNCGTSGQLQVFDGTTWASLIRGGLPGTPTIGTVTSRNGVASVPFTAPVSDGGAAILFYTATSFPGGYTGTLNQAGSGTITVSGLPAGEGYIFTVTASNETGTGPASGVSNTVWPITLGQSYLGGIIFYIDETGNHGLIAATADQGMEIIWALPTYNDQNVETFTEIGTGSTNTDHIIAQNGEGIYAASLARSYRGGGYSDWFLPSKDELNLLYDQKNVIGGFENGYYWSSSEYKSIYANQFDFAWVQYFGYYLQEYGYKSSPINIRAIRAF